MGDIFVWDRQAGRLVKEKVYAEKSLFFLYRANSWTGSFFRHVICRLPFLSFLYGSYQKCFWTRRKIAPFVQEFEVDLTHFVQSDYKSFNDFFIRKIDPRARPIAASTFVIPADGRYLVYQNIKRETECLVKGRTLSLFDFLGQNEELMEKYLGGSILFGRLAPQDYHRFHVPCACTPHPVTQLGRSLYSVNPIAFRWGFAALTQNKRSYTTLQTPENGDLLYMAVGATSVGSIHYTHQPHSPLQAGDELGYFSFGGSLVVLLFEKGSLEVAHDLLERSLMHQETVCRLGEKLSHT